MSLLLFLSHNLLGLMHHWLLLCKLEVGYLSRLILGPVVILFILNEVIQEQNVSKVNEAVGSISFLRLSVVGRYIQVVESAFVIDLEVLSDILDGVAAGNVANHEVCSGFFTTQDLFVVDRASIKLIVGHEGRVGVLLLQRDLAIESAT